MKVARVEAPEDNELFDRALDCLGRVPIFQTLAPEQLRAVAVIATCVEFRPGETIFSPGARNTALHVVLAGTVRLIEESVHGGPIKLAATREPGQCYGEIGFLTDQPPHMGALNGPERGQHLVLQRADFEALALRQPAIGQAVTRALIETLVKRMDNVPAYVRDYLLWGHRPRVTAPPERTSLGTPLFVAAGAGWGVLATVLWLVLEGLVQPHVVRTITAMGLVAVALTVAGAAFGFAMSAVVSALDRTKN